MEPSPADTTPPEVDWASPSEGEVIEVVADALDVFSSAAVATQALYSGPCPRERPCQQSPRQSLRQS